MTVTVSVHGNIKVIKLSGKFSFETHSKFMECCTEDVIERDKDKKFIVDMSAVEYMDSSGMGMLLHLRSFSEQRVLIKNPSKKIAEILHIANFDRLFDIK